MLLILIPITLIIAAFFSVLAIGGIYNSKDPYSCPNCGYIFTKKWYSLMFKSGPMVKDCNGELKLRCPLCKKIDFCQHTKER